EDVVGVAAGDAAVDDVGVEAGEVQRRQGADELQRHDGGDEPAVWLEMGAEKARQHQRASPFNRIEASWSADIRDSAEVPGCHIPKTRLRSTSAASWGVTRSSSAWGANTWSAMASRNLRFASTRNAGGEGGLSPPPSSWAM